MLLGTYHFLCRFSGPAQLPPFKGSTLRGVFGHALKRVVCALRQVPCEACILRERCLYTRVFETSLAIPQPAGARVSVAPHPFVIEPPLTGQTVFEAGEELDCGLTLLGEVNKSLPYFVYAFEQMGEIGIGRRLNGHRGQFVLEEVRTGGHCLYARGGEHLVAPPRQDAVLGHMPTPSPQACSQDRGTTLRVDLLTPLRLKHENRIRAHLPFHVLVRAALRRASSLFATWGDGEPALDYKGLVERAGNVRTVESGLRWHDWRRYSNRQEREMLLGGMTGSVVYEGPMAEYLPLLTLAEKVHLGKNTSFGMGRIRVAARP